MLMSRWHDARNVRHVYTRDGLRDVFRLEQIVSLIQVLQRDTG
jgi:hypothetical protein